MATKAVIQFLLFAQVLAISSGGGSKSSSPSGSISVSPSKAPYSSPQPSVSPSISPSQPGSVSPTTKTGSSIASSLGSVKPSLSPSSIPATTKQPSASLSQPGSRIPVSKTPSASQTPSVKPSITPSILSSKPSSIPSKASSMTSKASSPSSQPSGSISGSSSFSVSPSKPSSIVSKPASGSGSVSRPPSSIISKPSSIPSGSASKPSSIPSGSVSKPSSIPSKAPSSIPSGSASKPSSIPSGSASRPSSIPSKASSIMPSGSYSRPSSIPSSIRSGSTSPSGSKVVPSASAIPSSFKSSGSGSVPVSKPTAKSSISSSGSNSFGSSGSGKPSGSGSLPPYTKTTGSAVSGTKGGSAISSPATKTYGSGSSSPTGSVPPSSIGGKSSISKGSSGSGSLKPSVSTASACPTTCPSCPATTELGPTVTLGCGVVTGTTTSLHAATATVNKFLGIPFAQSPPRRFSPPQKGASCDVEAKAFKPACIQQFVYPKAMQEYVELVFDDPGGPPPAESEDCLYLNVYAPGSPAPAGGRAVMFWIYGGSLDFGTAGIAPYDGSHLAAYEDVIVVTSNYRTNVFGFPTSPEIPVSERNLGFLDQRAGLDWVQNNIAAFGGSDKVTIFGQSAGAFSVDALLTSFPANSTPPFRAAILESGQFSYNAASRPSTIPQWNQLAELMGCPGNYTSNLACLRAANATAIQNAIDVNIIEFNPVADGVTLVSDPMQQRLSGNIARIPILAGSNAQEGRVFAYNVTNTTAYLSTLLNNDTSLIETLEAAYPLNSSGIGPTDYDQSSQIFTELMFQCPAAYQTNATASIGIPAWRYYFNSSFSNFQPVPDLGVFHSSEIPLVFGTYNRTNVTVQQYALSRTMRGIWASFAKNPAAGPGWNRVGSGMEGSVLVGADSYAEGGIMVYENGTLAKGAYDLGVLGNRGDVLGSGVTIIDSSEVDYRCGLYAETYEMNAVIGGTT